MSIKRQATTDLNHDNWDQDDPSEHEEMGTFSSASKDVLEKRVIRTAKRRSQPQASDEAKKSVFSGFGGFNKTQPSSFDFLSNLTNGSKTSNGTASGKLDGAATSSLFSSKPAASGANANSGLFSIPVTSSPVSKPLFGMSNSTPSSLFSSSSSNSTSQSPFATSKTESNATEGGFKMQASSPSNDGKKTNSSSPFGTTSLFSSNNQNSSPLTTSNTILTNKSGSDADMKSNDAEDKKLKYYAKLKGLNESVSDWIKKHVEETPLCILTPIFKDYDKYLQEIQSEYKGQTKQQSDKTNENTNSNTKSPVKGSDTKLPINSSDTKSPVKNNDTGSSLFSSSVTKPVFGMQAAPGEKPSGFSFGNNTSSTSTTSSGKFSFGINTPPQTTMATSSPFKLSTNTNTSGSENAAPFSFGMGKPFSFGSNIQKPETPATEANDEDEPPKVEFTPVVEENSVFDKRCKIFVKKDGNFVDMGLGTLYVKKVEESGKHQLLVRANTNLGTVLLNLILTSSIPTQRLGKNNVMMVCIPTPDAKPPPTPVLIRVKTSEEADGLLETLNKYKT